tara:strand:+ start:30636 stop:30824 length:189 start_codon:yes stop_codon:yes gene_type:complete
MELIKVYLVFSDYGHGDKSLLIVTRSITDVEVVVREQTDNDEYVYTQYADDPPNMSIEEHVV